MRRLANNTAGFSLIELMIAVAVLGMIMSQMFLVLSTQKRAYVGSTRTMDVQESARLVTDLIAFDARMAGLMVPRFAGVSSTDGGDEGTDRLCTSDPDIFTIPDAADDDPLWDGRDSRFTGPVMTGPSTSASVDDKVTHTTVAGAVLTLDTLDVDNAGNTNDFAVDRGIILSTGAKTFCTRIAAINTGTRKITVVHPPGNTFAAGTTVVPAIIYEGPRDENDPPGLTRNALPLSSVIEDLQVEYWVDSKPPDCDGIMGGADEFPIHNLNDADNLERVRLVQVSVVARADLDDDSSGAPVARHRRPAVANREKAAEADAFRRRRFTTSVLPRNLLARPTTDPTQCPFVP